MCDTTKRIIFDSAQNNYISILSQWPSFAKFAPIQRFIELNLNTKNTYKYIPDECRSILQSVSAEFGAEAEKVFLRLVLLKSTMTIIESNSLQEIPLRLKGHHYQQLLRIANSKCCNDEWLDIDNDIFQKELCITTLRLYTSGCQLIDVHCGLPRSILFKQGIFKLPFFMVKFLCVGGFKPFFQIHMHLLTIDKFNEKERDECYLCCVELYKLFPKALGMFAGSWFYDPEVTKISPHLAYLSQKPIKAGAFIMYTNTIKDPSNNALLKSNTRRQLFLNGKYTPKNFMLIWAKKNQIKWAKNYS